MRGHGSATAQFIESLGGMNAVLRNAKPKDAQSLAVLSAAVWMSTYVTKELQSDVRSYVSNEFSPHRIASQITDAASHWTVAEVGGQIVGYAHLRHGEICPSSTQHRTELVNLYILEAFTGRGVGTQLLRKSENVVAAKAERLWLSVNSSNERAIGFYRHRGYRQIGELYFELGSERYKNGVLVRDSA